MNTEDGPSGEARILDAAIQLFGIQGFTGTSMREIAAEAEVSQALVVHHFGSKAALRRACDRHVANVTQDRKTSVSEGPQLDPFEALRQIENSRPLLRYLVRAITEGGDQASNLVDEFVADADEYLHNAVEAGYAKPSRTPHERAAVLVILSMGALAMHEHLHRLLGVDLLDANAPSEELAPYMRPMLELYSQGLWEAGALDQMIDMFDDPDSASAATTEPNS